MQLPGCLRSRTLLTLMYVTRLRKVIDGLLGYLHGCAGMGLKEASRNEGRRVGSPHPSNVSITIIERGSMSDQRVLVSTLADICVALESLGVHSVRGMASSRVPRGRDVDKRENIFLLAEKTD